MASIIARNLSVHYPLDSSPGTRLVGAPEPANMIHVRSKRYIMALQDFSLTISHGQRVGLIGRNGSGKSTLLRVLGGIYAPTSGYLETVGHISSLFNINLGIQPDATGRENIVIRSLLKGFRRRQINEMMDEIIAFSELEDFIDLPIRTYSDGMRMRLLFAIATCYSPEILLLDEWIGAGDSRFQAKAAERMTSLVSAAGVTVIASHNRALLRRVCEIGVWLDSGIMRAYGPIDEVYAELDAEEKLQNG